VESTVTALFLVLLLAGPLAGYTRATRRPGATRGQLVLSATLGGAFAGALLVACLVFAMPPISHAPARLRVVLPYGLIYTAWGAVVGLCGVFARSLGVWLSRRR
jgi:hypothetical protein